MNVIPVIARSDTILPKEIPKLKAVYIVELGLNHIVINKFPEDDEVMTELNKSMNEHIPFGSTNKVQVRKKMAMGTEYL